jgi:ABC-2 type transport system permease protein
VGKTLLVARREYIESVRTKAFLIGVLATPVIMVAAIVIPMLLNAQAKDPRTIRIVDLGAGVAIEVKAKIDEINATNKENATRAGSTSWQEYPVEIVETSATTLAAFESGDLMGMRAALSDPVKLTAVVAIPANAAVVEIKPVPDFPDGSAMPTQTPTPVASPSASPASSTETAVVERIRYYTYAPSDFDTQNIVRIAVQKVIQARRMKQTNVDRATLDAITAPVLMETPQLADSQESELFVRTSEGDVKAVNQFEQVFTPLVFLIVLYIGTLGMSQMLLTTVIEEKSTRLMEVLLASVTPRQLMAGKIIGTLGVALTLIGIWAIAGLGTAGSQQYDLPVKIQHVGLFVAYFAGAYLLYATLLAAVGSLCTTLKEAQNFMLPITLFTIVPWLVWMPIVQDPSGTLAVVLSYVPPLTPFVMMMRISSMQVLPMGEVILTLTLLYGSVVIAFILCAKIFRTGVLLYGKPPRIREIFRWMSQA